MAVMSLFFCAFAVVFVLMLVLAILTQTGVLNRRLAGILGLVIILPLICGMLLMFIISFTTISGTTVGM